MENTGNHARLRAHAEPHVNIADLCHRGKGDHPADVVFPDGGEGAEDHAHQSENKEYVNNSCTVKDIKANHAVNNFNQKEDITLGHQTGKDSLRKILWSIRKHPGAMREKGTARS